MKKIKIGVAILAFVLLMCLCNTKVDAAVNYTRTITGNDGSITLNLTGLELDITKAYSFALTTKGGTPTTWHTITEYTATTATVELRSSTEDILNVLKVTDTGVLYIKEDSSDSNILSNFEVNLKLPYMYAANVSGDDSLKVNKIYGYKGTVYYQFQKIQDKTVIEKYLDYKNNGTQLKESDFAQTAPTTGFSSDWTIAGGSYCDLWHQQSSHQGLYYFWVQYTNDNCKNIVGYYIFDGLPDATKVEQYIEGLDVESPTVKSIQIERPNSGTYKTPQTVKIRVYFNEAIKGSNVPTLKIKFGDSEERSLTNGTITNNLLYYIEYSYNIQDSDKGQLQTVSLEGGSITDEEGNAAKLSCPALSGSRTIKANIDGAVNNNTDNQDQNNDNTNKDDNKDTNQGTSDNGTSNNGNNNSSTGTNSESSDKTTSTGRLPQTGVSMSIVIAMVAIAGIGVIGFLKYCSYRDIK